MGLGVWGLGVGGLGFRVQGVELRFTVWGLGCRVQGLWFMVEVPEV